MRKDDVKVIGLGYERAHHVLPGTVKKGKKTEDNLKKLLGSLGYFENEDYQSGKKVIYSNINKEASISADIAIPNADNPHIIITSTHSDPTIPGHSNENKLHQAIGELYLFKTYNPKICNIIYIGGEKKNWLPYVTNTIEFFYDATVYEHDPDPINSLKTAFKGSLKHEEFWKNEKKIRNQNNLSTESKNAPDANLRTNFFKNVVGQYLGKVNSVNEIQNSILKKMMEFSINSNGKLWSYLREGKSNNFYQERSIFNPPEIVLFMLLESRDFEFRSELKNKFDEMIICNNLLYDLGHTNSHRRTDFILETRNGKKVYIECKSAGGGEGGKLTKHITDRSREQIARSIFHRCSVEKNILVSKKKDFHWYYVLDNRWRTPTSYPLKYLHILEMCGVDRCYSCDDLVDSEYEPNYSFSLLDELERIGCRKL